MSHAHWTSLIYWFNRLDFVWSSTTNRTKTYTVIKKCATQIVCGVFFFIYIDIFIYMMWPPCVLCCLSVHVCVYVCVSYALRNTFIIVYIECAVIIDMAQNWLLLLTRVTGVNHLMGWVNAQLIFRTYWRVQFTGTQTNWLPYGTIQRWASWCAHGTAAHRKAEGRIHYSN